MDKLGQFAELIKEATAAKQVKIQQELAQKKETYAPLLTDLFSTVVEGKKKKEEIVTKEAPLLSELTKTLFDPTSVKQSKEEKKNKIVEMVQRLESELEEAKEVEPIIQQVVDNSGIEKKITEMFQRLQKDFQTLKHYVNNKPPQYISGGGSVRILDNDDVEFSPLSKVTENSILIFDSSKQKFVLKDLVEYIQTIQTGVDVQYNKIVETIGSFTYIGEAMPGSTEVSSVWRIRRIETVGDIMYTLWADGTSDFIKSWSDKLTYTYS